MSDNIQNPSKNRQVQDDCIWNGIDCESRPLAGVGRRGMSDTAITSTNQESQNQHNS